MKVVSKTKTKVSLGGGRELKKSDNYTYTIMRDGLRTDVQFDGIQIGDSVLCWTENGAKIG